MVEDLVTRAGSVGLRPSSWPRSEHELLLLIPELRQLCNWGNALCEDAQPGGPECPVPLPGFVTVPDDGQVQSALILTQWGIQMKDRDSHLAVFQDVAAAARHCLQGHGIGTRTTLADCVFPSLNPAWSDWTDSIIVSMQVVARRERQSQLAATFVNRNQQFTQVYFTLLGP